MKDPIPIYLAVEDELSERTARRALSMRPVHYAVGAVFCRGGYGYLKKQAPAFNHAANACPFLLLTDLDQSPCPPQLVADWLSRPKHPHFLLRVAVREIESWLLGDPTGLREFLGLRRPIDFPDPEGLPDPKQEFLRLALSSPRRRLREALVWRDDHTGRFAQGPDYNGALAGFVSKDWDITGASTRCRSLHRLFIALGRVEAELSPP